MLDATPGVHIYICMRPLNLGLGKWMSPQKGIQSRLFKVMDAQKSLCHLRRGKVEELPELLNTRLRSAQPDRFRMLRAFILFIAAVL